MARYEHLPIYKTAQQPGDDIDPLTYALVDEDEEVRARAEELWEQQLTQEATETPP